MKHPKRIFLPQFMTATIVASCIFFHVPTFSQSDGFDYSRIPSDTTIVSDHDGTMTLHTPDGDKNIHYVDGGKASTKRKTRAIASGVLLILATGAAIVTLNLKNKRKRIAALEKELDKGRQEIASLESDLELIRNHSDSMSATVAEMLENQVQIVRSIIDKHSSMKEQKGETTYFDKLEALRETVGSYNEYLEHLRKDVDLVGGFEKALDVKEDNIMKRLRSQFGGKMSEEDYRILSCIFVGMSPSGISFVTGIPAGTIRTRKSRYKSRIEALPDSAEKRLFLRFFDK